MVHDHTPQTAREFEVQVQSSNSIGHLKGQLQALAGMPPTLQSIRFNNRIISFVDSETLGDFGIQENDIVKLCIRALGGGEGQKRGR